MTIAILFLCLFAGALFARQLFSLLKIALWLALALFALRFIGSLDISAAAWSNMALGAIGAFAVAVACYRFIHNGLVNSDRAGDHQGVDKKHDVRLI